MYHFYPELFAHIALNNLNKILSILLKGFNDTDKNERYTYKIFKEKVIERYLKLSPDLVYKCIYYINKRVGMCIFEHRFVFYKKKADYTSPKLEVVVDS